MKATEAKLLSFLQKSPQFVIPIYQRTYSWTDKQCRQLWDDILRAGSNDSIAVHFIGSIVYVEQGLSQVTELLKEQKGDLAHVCRGLAKLVVVDIALSRDQDNPQLIFESMNSTGKELSQADLIRNYILMGLEPALQPRLYEEYWRPMELDFGQEAYGTQFDSFMRHYLTVCTGDIPRERDVYEAFKDYSRTTPVQGAGIEAFVKEIRAFARYFCALALGREQDATLSLTFHDLRELKVEVAYPFLLELYHDYANGTLSTADFATQYHLLTEEVTEITPRRTGQLFLFVNDAVGPPGWRSFFYENNQPGPADPAKVRIRERTGEHLARRDETVDARQHAPNQQMGVGHEPH